MVWTGHLLGLAAGRAVASVTRLPALVTKSLLASLLGYTVRGLNKLIARGVIPHPFKIGRRSYWRRRTLVKFFVSLEGRRQRTGGGRRP